MKLREYVYVDTNDFDDRYLRVEIFDVLPDLKKWALSKRPRVLRAAENYVKACDRNVARLNRLHERARKVAGNDFTSLFERALFEYEDGLMAAMSRSIFGRKPGKGHHVPDCTVFEGERWVWDEEPEPYKPMGLWGIITRKGAIRDAEKLSPWNEGAALPMSGFGGAQVIYDEMVPEGTAYLVNPAHIHYEPSPFWDTTGVAAPLTAEELDAAIERVKNEPMHGWEPEPVHPMAANILKYGTFSFGRGKAKITPAEPEEENKVVAWYPEGHEEDRHLVHDPDRHHDDRYDDRFEEWHDMGGDA